MFKEQMSPQEATAVTALYQLLIPTQAALKWIYFQSLTDLQQQAFNNNYKVSYEL